MDDEPKVVSAAGDPHLKLEMAFRKLSRDVIELCARGPDTEAVAELIASLRHYARSYETFREMEERCGRTAPEPEGDSILDLDAAREELSERLGRLGEA